MKLPRGLAMLVVAAGCGGPKVQPPLGEALVIVDTDAAVPLLVSRLRVDAYTTGGMWYASNDFSLPAPSYWPASFGAYTPDSDQGKTVILRLRAYADGNVRDYRGERYMERPSGKNPSETTPLPPTPKGEAPRLLDADGKDVTPPTEPEPLLTIDRLLLVTVAPGLVESVRVKLEGACFGTMADVESQNTCIDTEDQRSPLSVATLDPDLGVPSTTAQGSFGPEPCKATPRAAGTGSDGDPLYDEEVCVPGGAFVFGTESLPDIGLGTAVPERVAVIPPFRMDRYLVTVARWRQALLDGFVPPVATPPLPIVNDSPFPTTPSPSDIFTPAFCTYSDEPMGREAFPVTCLDWDTARAFCQFLGGDLPAESQWEYAATVAGRSVKTAFPWGGADNADPVCAQSVFGRGYDETESTLDIGECTPQGFGPLAVDARDYRHGAVPAGVVGLGDVSVGLGIVGLGANAQEWILDTTYSLGSNCWMSQPLSLPECIDPAGQNRSLRGAEWDAPQQYTFSSFRFYAPRTEVLTTEGLRCVRSGAP
jgi:formylglycine-generating enzyme required for sulfatase activity